jgi:hypothetical protein
MSASGPAFSAFCASHRKRATCSTFGRSIAFLPLFTIGSGLHGANLVARGLAMRDNAPASSLPAKGGPKLRVIDGGLSAQLAPKPRDKQLHVLCPGCGGVIDSNASLKLSHA